MQQIEHYKTYVISQHAHHVNTDQQGRIKLTRWRVSRPIVGSPDAQHLVRDNFASLAHAKAFIDQGCKHE